MITKVLFKKGMAAKMFECPPAWQQEDFESRSYKELEKPNSSHFLVYCSRIQSFFTNQVQRELPLPSSLGFLLLNSRTSAAWFPSTSEVHNGGVLPVSLPQTVQQMSLFCSRWGTRWGVIQWDAGSPLTRFHCHKGDFLEVWEADRLNDDEKGLLLVVSCSAEEPFVVDLSEWWKS